MSLIITTFDQILSLIKYTNFCFKKPVEAFEYFVVDGSNCWFSSPLSRCDYS